MLSILQFVINLELEMHSTFLSSFVRLIEKMRFALDRQRFFIIGIASQTSVVCLLLGLSLAKDVPALFIFGDSLVDVGNNFYIKTIATPFFPNGIDFGSGDGVPSGRYSNGRIVSDIIGQELGFKNFPPPYLAPTTVGDVLLQGVNYASSGSGILNSTGESYGDRIGMDNQVGYFEKTRQDIISNIGVQAAKKLLRKAVYFVATGANDLMSTSKMDLDTGVLDTIISSLRSQLTSLYELDARKFVVGNAGPYGCIPFIKDNFGVKDGCLSVGNERAQSYNKKLKPMLEELTKNLSGSLYVHADFYAVFLDIVQNYISYGFEDVANACCYVFGAHGGILPCSSISHVCPDRTAKVFWDPFHLTDTANLIAAKHLVDGGLNYISPLNFRQLIDT